MDIGRFLATCDDEEQAQVFNVMGKDLNRHCGGSQKFDMQCCYIVDHLDHNGKDLIKRLAAFIESDSEAFKNSYKPPSSIPF